MVTLSYWLYFPLVFFAGYGLGSMIGNFILTRKDR